MDTRPLMLKVVNLSSPNTAEGGGPTGVTRGLTRLQSGHVYLCSKVLHLMSSEDVTKNKRKERKEPNWTSKYVLLWTGARWHVQGGGQEDKRADPSHTRADWLHQENMWEMLIRSPERVVLLSLSSVEPGGWSSSWETGPRSGPAVFRTHSWFDQPSCAAQFIHHQYKLIVCPPVCYMCLQRSPVATGVNLWFYSHFILKPLS